MKKLFMGSIVLCVFSISIVIFQASCTKSLEAETTTSAATQLNKILFEKFDRVANKQDGIYIANYDGSNPVKINIVLPGLTGIQVNGARLSPDGKLVFFAVYS